jgi:DNA polymerase III alpha subunit
LVSKFDILSQRIGHIDDTVKLVAKKEVQNKHSGYKISKNEIKPIPIYQRKQYHRLFYIESPAMRGLLRRLKCDTKP